MGSAKLIIIIFSVLFFIVVLFASIILYNSSTKTSFSVNKADCTKFINIVPGQTEASDCGYLSTDNTGKIHHFLAKVLNIEDEQIEVAINVGGVSVTFLI